MNRTFLIFLVLSFYIHSQSDLIKQKEYADSIFFSQNYFDAIKEYKRLMFFDKEKIFTYYSLNQIARCYKYGRKFEDSYNFFSLALSEANSIKEIFDVKVNICRLNIIERKIINAHRILDDLEKDSLFKEYKSEIKYWRAWAYFFEMEYIMAMNIFNELELIELSNLSQKSYQNHYSVSTAKILSMILPGVGQFYTGNYLNGLGSFAWNLLSVYLTIKAFSEERIFDGTVLANFLWFRFYRGNIENAEKFAIQKNEETLHQTLQYFYSKYPEEIP